MRRPLHYDRQGQPIELLDWAAKFENPAYMLVVETTLASGTRITTIWIGLDHRFSGDGPPLIFETTVRGGVCSGEGERYATEAEAEVGHKRWVEHAIRRAREED